MHIYLSLMVTDMVLRITLLDRQKGSDPCSLRVILAPQ